MGFEKIPSFISGTYKLVRTAGLIGTLKTIFWNFKLLPFGQAVKFPIIIGGSCSLSMCKRGCIQFDSERIRPGLLLIGTECYGFPPKGGVMIRIEGKLIVKGSGLHWFGSNGYLTISKTGILEIGDDFQVGNGWCIYVSEHSYIGSNCMFSWNILLLDTDCHPITDCHGVLINPSKAFIIEDRVWLGAYSKILKGAHISSGCIVGTGSVVSSNLDKENSIYVGNRNIRNEVYWSKQPL